jgi:hypothetical protein
MGVGCRIKKEKNNKKIKKNTCVIRTCRSGVWYALGMCGVRVVLDGRVGLRREEPLLILAEGDAAPATPASVFVLLYCVTSPKVQRLTQPKEMQRLQHLRQYLYFCTAFLAQKYKD